MWKYKSVTAMTSAARDNATGDLVEVVVKDCPTQDCPIHDCSTQDFPTQGHTMAMDCHFESEPAEIEFRSYAVATECP